MATSEKTRQVIHLHFLDSDTHFYFGSIKAMYENFKSIDLGVAEQTLYNKWKDNPYKTEIVVLRKGRLIQKRQSKPEQKLKNK
jgi:hypothetical protein